MSRERYVSKVTVKGQVTIPREIRDRLGLGRGEYLVWESRGDTAVVRRAPVDPTEDVGALAASIAERFAEKGITREDVEDAIRWARSRS